MPAFARYTWIDYSGTKTSTASLKGLRVYVADRSSPPVEVIPLVSPRKYWTRRGIAEWLLEQLTQDAPTLVGITILLPGVLLLLRAPFLFGYAKPVPVNFRALRWPRGGMVLVAAAGPAMNIALAVLAGLAFHFVGFLPVWRRSYCQCLQLGQSSGNRSRRSTRRSERR